MRSWLRFVIIVRVRYVPPLSLIPLFNAMLTNMTQELTRFPKLHGQLIEVVSELLRERLSPTSEYAASLIDIQAAYINTNHPAFISGSAVAAQGQGERAANPPRVSGLFWVLCDGIRLVGFGVGLMGLGWVVENELSFLLFSRVVLFRHSFPIQWRTPLTRRNLQPVSAEPYNGHGVASADEDEELEDSGDERPGGVSINGTSYSLLSAHSRSPHTHTHRIQRPLPPTQLEILSTTPTLRGTRQIAPRLVPFPRPTITLHVRWSKTHPLQPSRRSWRSRQLPSKRKRHVLELLFRAERAWECQWWGTWPREKGGGGTEGDRADWERFECCGGGDEYGVVGGEEEYGWE